ncbi:MBL fold metallo-hydrolase [Akkermansiaceae bacterium]|nr:MBL fold metallo-hydrolase [Akkermansiaceae bacterium]MDB4675559.1 MBL fold metallo-hydrolase [Akkermansiaceae bacterium]
MPDKTTFRLKFWGTRGSIPCPGPDTIKYGGNTTCFEVTCGSRRIIIDAGTGIRALGQKIMLEEDNLLDADIFLTHTHIDHIQGLPFFAPLYNPKNNIRLHAGHLKPPCDLQSLIDTILMKAPIFPVPSSLIKQACTFDDYKCGQIFELEEGVVVRTGKLNHPNGACGYRIEFAGKAIAICTDTEHFEDDIDQNVVSLSQDADVMVYDSAYTQENYPKFKGWGHSTWQEAVKVAETANVKQTFLFHHDPSHDDTKMDAIAKEVAKIRSGVRPAVEGEEIEI